LTGAQTPWRGKFLEIRVDGTWEYAVRPGGMEAAIIIPIDEAPDGQYIILIEEYRVPLGAWCIGFPAGLIGDTSADDDAASAAARELEEETGYHAAEWSLLGRFASSPGLTDECVTIFEARALTKVSAGGGVDGENIVIHRIRREDIGSFLETKRTDGRVIDVKLLALLTH
jgi:ADP-ribose pyrophosphatase